MWYIIIFVVWLIGAIVSYKYFDLGWGKAEKIYFSIIWPLLIPLYLIYLMVGRRE